ncbi:MAG: acyl-CoA dehydrogenase family protein, partial [Alphaproteobacteria bacterium]
MDLSLPEEIRSVKETVARVVERDILPALPAYEERAEFPRALIASLGEAGLFGAAFPEELGGTDLGFLAV